MMDEERGLPTATGTTPQLMRALNQRTVYDALKSMGTASRAQISRVAGLSKPTVSVAVADLERAGLIRATGRELQVGLGKAGLLFEPDPAAGYVLGLDVGRRWVRAGVADLSGSLLGRTDLPNTGRSSAGLLNLICDASARAQLSAGIGADQIVSAYVGGPGVPDQGSRRHRYAPNLPGWTKPGMLDELQAALGYPVDSDNDVACATTAEAELGAARGAQTFVYLWIGSGVGMGIWIDGRLFRGSSGFAGEVGLLPLAPTTGMDNSQLRTIERRQGLVEREVSAQGIVRAAREAGMRVHDAKEVFTAAAAGSGDAARIVEQEGRRLAHVVAAIVAVLDPGLLILGGAVGRNSDQLAPPLAEELSRLSPLRPRILPAQLGDDAVLLGAVTAALSTARDQVFADRMTAPRLRQAAVSGS
jgi:predicted NBD/HSP70 family sugar kinase